MALAPDRDLISSTVLQGFNSSSLGELLPHESLVLHMVRRQKRLVNELRMEVASERKLAVLRVLDGKNVNKRLPSALRNAEGHPVKDQSCWRSLIHEHFGKKSAVRMYTNQRRRVYWKMKVWEALQRGQSPEELSFEEFLEVFRLVKPNIAAGRDNVLGTILRFLPGAVQNQLYRAIVQRLTGRTLTLRAGRSSISAWFQKKGDFSKLSNWRPISLVPTLCKVYEMYMWKVLDKELRPLPNQLVGFRPGVQCLDIVSFLVESLRKADEWGEKLFVVSMDVASAFDSVSAQVLGDVLLERGATTISAAAAVRENLELRARPCLGFTKSASFSLDVGMRQGEHFLAGTRSWRC